MKGCGDHSCVVEKPKGQGTNGGCRCSPIALRRKIWEQEAEIKQYQSSVIALECFIRDNGLDVDEAWKGELSTEGNK